MHQIAALNLSKIYLMKNAKETSKLSNRNLHREWTKFVNTTGKENDGK